MRDDGSYSFLFIQAEQDATQGQSYVYAAITDDTAKVAWQWPYSAFGDNKPSGILQTGEKTANGQTITQLKATPPTLTLNLRLPGQYWDEESRLSYNYFRSYRPAQGRYDQPDPIGLEGG